MTGKAETISIACQGGPSGTTSVITPRRNG